MSVIFSFNQSCLHITCDMTYVIHENEITFIVIVIVIVIAIYRRMYGVPDRLPWYVHGLQ